MSAIASNLEHLRHLWTTSRSRTVGAAKTVLRRARSGALRRVEARGNVVLMRDVPHGFSPYYDLKRRKPEMRVVVDVGANVGQTAALLTRTWPTAAVYCIEPFGATFEALQRNTEDEPRVRCVRAALGDRIGEEQAVVLRPRSVNNSMLTPEAVASAAAGATSETISVTTFDQFCIEQGLSHVDFLKIDTEGYDLHVLRGARAALQEQRISFIQVEAGMSPENTKHVPFAEIQQYLEQNGYVLFGIYDQTPEWDGQARLRFANPIFVAQREVSLPTTDLSFARLHTALAERGRR